MPRDPIYRGTFVYPIDPESGFVGITQIRPGSSPADIVDVREHWGEVSDKRQDKHILDMMGRGIAYPFEFNDMEGVSCLQESWGRVRIEQSIFLILSTRPGERFFNPAFGSRLPLLAFEPYDDTLCHRLEIETRMAVETWEPRIHVLQVDILDDESWVEKHQIGISIYYVMKNSNISGNYVYPFQLRGEDAVM